MVDAQTGLFTGIIWAGAADKTGNVQNDSYLNSLLGSDIEDDELVWNQMNYAVPADKIRSVIEASLELKSVEERGLLQSVFKL